MYTNPTIHNLFYANMQFQLFILHAGQYTNPTIHHSFRGARAASTQIPIQINQSFRQIHTHHSSLIRSNAHPKGQYTDPTIQNSFKPIKNPMIQHSFRPNKYIQLAVIQSNAQRPKEPTINQANTQTQFSIH
jgi:hypothetical protein